MKKQIEIIERQQERFGFLKLESIQFRHSLFAGGLSQPIRRDRMVDRDAVGVLLFDPEAQQLVLIEQFRVGALEQGEGAWLLEIVAGYVGKDEDPEQVARREALEEAEAEISGLIPISKFWVSPGASDETFEIFCGIVDSSKLGGIHGLDDEDEDIQLVKLGIDEALAELYGGRANSTSIIIALQWLAIHRDRIRFENGSWSLCP